MVPKVLKLDTEDDESAKGSPIPGSRLAAWTLIVIVVVLHVNNCVREGV